MDPRRAGARQGRPRTGSPGRRLAWLLVVLAAAAGSLDVFCIVRLGGAFASVITGNLVQLGRGAVDLDPRLAGAAAAAVGGYAAGVAAGTAALGGHRRGRRSRSALAVAGELALLVCLSAAWQAYGGRPGRVAADVLLATGGAAMGVQSAVTLATGVRGASTTYLTGTLTDVVRGLTSTRRGAGVSGEAARLGALLCGAVAGALVLRAAPLWAPVLPAVLVAAVLLVAAVRPPDLPDRDPSGPGRAGEPAGDEKP